MRRSNYFTIIGACVFLLFAMLFFPKDTVPTITYFPLDTEDQFQHATNTLQLHHKNKADTYTMSWKNHSETSKPFYLRQDVSVLFKNGKLIGLKSIWKEDVKTINFNETFHFSKDYLFQAVTLHYGEKHNPDNEIKSLQQMSYSDLYVKGTIQDNFMSFQQPKTHQDWQSQNELKKKTKENLLHHWHRLTSHFNIDLAQYDVVPLTELYQFKKTTLFSFTQKQTNEIVAKLWEGLYKNYIIPASKIDSESTESYVPLILFDKHEHHILVLFDLNGEMQKLKQIYPDF